MVGFLCTSPITPIRTRLAPRDLTLILRQSQIQRLALIGMLNTHPVLLLRAVVMEPSAHQSRQWDVPSADTGSPRRSCPWDRAWWRWRAIPLPDSVCTAVLTCLCLTECLPTHVYFREVLLAIGLLLRKLVFYSVSLWECPVASPEWWATGGVGPIDYMWNENIQSRTKW